MNPTLNKIIKLRHICEAAIIRNIAETHILGSVTRHEDVFTQFTVRYADQDFVVTFYRLNK